MQRCNGTESRHLINMPFIWPLHSSLKQDLSVRTVHPGASLGRKVQPAKIMRLVCYCLVCSFSPWTGRRADSGTGFGSDSGSGSGSEPFVYPFVLIYLHAICFSLLFFHGVCLKCVCVRVCRLFLRSRLSGRLLLMTVVWITNMHCMTTIYALYIFVYVFVFCLIGYSRTI